MNISESTVGRIWRAHGLKPHRITGFKLSNDKQFQEKLEAARFAHQAGSQCHDDPRLQT